jgi:hypothetical protein
MPIVRLNHAALHIRDLDRSLAFLHRATGRKTRLRPPMLGDGSVLAGAAVLGTRAASGPDHARRS